MSDQKPRNVFISYVRENQKEVDRLYRDLENHGVKVWLDRKSIKPGARWKDAIRKAIRHGDFFIACFSKEYASRQKNFMNEELTLAIEELRQFASDREWFIPVLLSECNVPARSIGAGETLRDINWVPLYEDWDAGIQRILSVIKPTPVSVQSLVYALRSEDGDVRESAAMALGRIGPKARGAVPLLIETLKDEHAGASFEAADALAEIGLGSVPTLIEALKDEDKAVRRGAVAALEKIGLEAVPALIKALKDHDRDVCWSAAEVLRYIGPGAIPDLVKTLKDKNEDFGVRWEAAAILGEIGLEAVPALIEALKSGDPIVRWRAAEALSYIGPKAKAAMRALTNILKDKYENARDAAARALEEINTPEAQKVLEEYKQKSK